MQVRAIGKAADWNARLSRWCNEFLRRVPPHSAQFKFQLLLEALKELKTIHELAREHEVCPSQVSKWKRQVLEVGNTIFICDRVSHHR
jgi:transposase-like protein